MRLITAQAPTLLHARQQGLAARDDDKCTGNADCHLKDPTTVCRRNGAGKCGQPGPNCLGICLPTCRKLKCPAGMYCTSLRSPQPGAVGCLPIGSAS
jgi:hypothetical protein